jgi:hypothetical protein
VERAKTPTFDEIVRQVDICHDRATRGFGLFGEETDEAAGILFMDLCQRLNTIQRLLERMAETEDCAATTRFGKF